jgi:uncharacterized protein YndB with AHSA1/START domain
MTDRQSAAIETVAEEFVISRTFDAPRALVFKAWTEPEALARWWGPQDFANTVLTLDVRPGGTFHYSMQPPEGELMRGVFRYREIAPPERLVFIDSFADAAGNTIRPPFSETFPLEILNTVTFTEQDGRTTVTVHGIPFNATDTERAAFAALHESMQQGWGGTLEELGVYLATA